MADEVRRSGRATKGQHTKNIEVPDSTTPRRGGKNNRSKTSKQTSNEATPAEDIIRCICGYVVEDKDDDRTMVQCDNCQAWQHNECMEISEDQDDLPDHYYCEQCRPDDHKGLLAKITRGEKPWEERAKQREFDEEERKAKRRKGGKKGKRGRPSDLKPEKVEDYNGSSSVTSTPAKATPVTETAVSVKSETAQKRKLQGEEASETMAANEQEPSSKVRKVSDSKDVKVPPQKRKSSVMATPERHDSKGLVLQTELVENVSELQSEMRRKSATALVTLFVEQTRNAEKQGTFRLSPGQPVETFGLKLGLAVEYAMYLNFCGTSGEPTAEYRHKLLSILHNVKANAVLRDRLLSSSLSPNEFTKMSSDDMASKELKEKTAEMKKEVEKQHMLIQEEGPRIRRTHKGEEFIGDGSQHMAGTESIYANAPARRRESELDLNAPKRTSPAPMSPQSPNAVELPNDISYTSTAHSPTSTKPLSVDTKVPSRPSLGHDRKSSAAFNIQNVWSSVDSPDTDKQRIRQLPQRQTSGNVQEQVSGLGVQVDADIDHLLKDEEPEDEEPYSPTDYSDPSTVWRGKMVMASVAEFSGTAKHVAGANLGEIYPWSQLMPHALSIEGRISIERASEYLCGLRWSKTTDVSVIAITPNDEPDAQIGFDNLFKYFTERKRYGVIGKSPATSVRDIYVVPLEAGIAKKPEFIELLEYCTIEDPCPERMLLVTYVIKSKADPTSSAQATPRHFDSAAAASPISTQHGQYRPLPHAQSASHMPPLQPYTGAASYGSPTQHQHAFVPSQPQQAQRPYSPPPPYSSILVGMDAARHVLGDMASVPSVAELLAQAPSTGVVQFEFVKEFLENLPASRTDFGMLMNLLAMKTQMNGRGA